MIRNDTRKMLVFDTPPGNEGHAHERIQLVHDDPDLMEIFRRATSGPPASEEEGAARIKAAGPYPRNLVKSRWNDVYEFAKQLKNHGWKVDVNYKAAAETVGPSQAFRFDLMA